MTTSAILYPDQEQLTLLLAKLGYQPASTDDQQAPMQLRGLRNPDGSLRWVWSATLRQPLFLDFYNASSLKAQLFCALIRLLFACGLHRWFFRPLPGRWMCTGVAEWLPTDFALFTGTPGPYRKAVGCYLDESGQRVFAKLPLTPAAAAKVQTEAKMLLQLATRPSISFRVPTVVAAEPTVLLQRGVQPARRASRSGHFQPQHLAYLREQLRATSVERSLAITAFWQAVQQQVEMLHSLADTRIPYGIRTKLQRLLEQVQPEQTITLAFAHGDFTPWNCWLAPDHLALYDLEFALPEAPLLYDLFHFHVQQGILVSRQSAAELRKQLWQQARTHFASISEQQLQLALRLYLLHQISHFLLVYHAQQEWHTQVQWLLTGWNELLTLELATYVEHRQLCLYDLLDTLQVQSAGVVLKQRAANAYYPAPTSDVDLLLPLAQAKQLANRLQSYPLVRSAGVRQQAHMVSVDCLFLDGSFLSVDLLHQMLRKAVQMLDETEVLAHAGQAAFGVPVPALRHDFEYTWLFYWLNQSDMPTGHLQHFERCAPQDQRMLLDYLVDKYDLHFESLASVARYQPLIAEHLHYLVSTQPGNSYLRRQWRTVRYALSTVISFFRPKGFVITFSGVDGAGKSTVIEHIKERLEKKWRKRVVVIRHRPSVLPILSVWKYGRAEAEKRAVQTLPRQGANQKLSSSLLRFSYYYLDYLLGQVVVWLKYTCRGHVVLYDRYYFDFINDSRRSNICLPERLTSALYTFVNKPRLNFFLYAAPEEILRRKQELSGDTIRELTQKYQALFGQLSGRYRQSQYVPIENNSLDATLTLIGQYIQQEIK
ncbi:hypothetical protein [Hymenobacter crusticola]|uniref:Thymidylate kinase-like domain-containing protein n=1 Tax=Hymenobacter crusticola TaxID=1770526 RepID=A0A243W6D1_9BACT|nr:hypothetical protein [Hymenobacter crusticola]OUJ69831.1 hypothetical protein BXP70_26030 [Hymenobacter crusticola]